jgi:hypothetical protein
LLLPILEILTVIDIRILVKTVIFSKY